MLRNDYLDAPVSTRYIAEQHVERYHFAAKQLESGMRVLDVACGTGYGSAILKQEGFDVVAADLGRDQLLQARTVHGIRKLVWANALQLPFGDGELDAVVTFETIEHVVDGYAFLEEMRRILKPGGILICSTPNIQYTGHPAFHLKEYAVDEFFMLVEQVFSNATRYVQCFTQTDYEADLRKRKLNRIKRIIRKSPLAFLVRPFYRWVKREDKVRSVQSPDGVNRTTRDASPYRVRSWDSDKHLVRIMVAVAVKDDHHADRNLRTPKP